MANKCTIFDGTNGEIRIPDDASFNLEHEDNFSFSFWVKKNTATFDASLFYKTGGSTSFYHCEFSSVDNSIVFNLTGAVEILITTPVIEIGKWTHIAFTFDKGFPGVTPYINGVAATTQDMSSLTDAFDVGGDLVLGGNEFADSFTGSLDDFRIYKATLTSSEVANIYNGGAGCKYNISQTPDSGAAVLVMEFDAPFAGDGSDETYSTIPDTPLVGTKTGGVTIEDGGVGTENIVYAKSIIKAVATGFYNQYDTGTCLKNKLTGGLHFMKASDNVTYPFGVFIWDGSTIDEICGGQDNRIEHINFTVSLFSNADDGGSQLFDIVEEFTFLFDWCVLSYVGFYHLACKRNSITNIGMLDNVTQVDIEYELIISHS